MHFLIYYLKTVANDVINMSLFAYIEISIDLLRRSTPDFIAPDMTLWPPNSPDLNPVDYSIWSVMQQRVYHSRVNDVDELRERLISVWCELDQSVVNDTIDEWRRHRPVSMLKGDILNITYYCYSQNNNVEMATL